MWVFFHCMMSIENEAAVEKYVCIENGDFFDIVKIKQSGEWDCAKTVRFTHPLPIVELEKKDVWE